MIKGYLRWGAETFGEWQILHEDIALICHYFGGFDARRQQE